MTDSWIDNVIQLHKLYNVESNKIMNVEQIGI
jgi:hypothetical protein